MTVTLNLKPAFERELRELAARRGETLDELAQGVVEGMLADLKNRPVPQSLDELKPRVLPPSGKTIKDMLPTEPWPGEETDQELLAALKALD